VDFIVIGYSGRVEYSRSTTPLALMVVEALSATSINVCCCMRCLVANDKWPVTWRHVVSVDRCHLMTDACRA